MPRIILSDFTSWKPGKKLLIRPSTPTNSLPHEADDIEYNECTFSELDLRSNTNITKLVIRHHSAAPLKIYFPPNVSSLVLHDCDSIECMNEFPVSLHALIIRNTICKPMLDIYHLCNLTNFHFESMATELPPLPPTLKELHYQRNNHPLPPELPPKLEYLYCSHCPIETLPSLPSTLTFLRCHETLIRRLPPLPAGLTCLDIRDSKLEHLDPLPKHLDELDVQNNELRCIPEIPTSVEYLNICSNPIQYYPYINRTDIRAYYDMNQLGAAFKYTSFQLNGIRVYTPLHMLAGLEIDYETEKYMIDIFDDTTAQLRNIRRLQVMCEIQTQVRCRAFMKTIKEELMMRTWHPSRIEAWCGVDFMANDD